MPKQRSLPVQNWIDRNSKRLNRAKRTSEQWQMWKEKNHEIRLAEYRQKTSFTVGRR